MKLIRCINGHYYDEEKYTSCPHCNSNEQSANGTVPFAQAGTYFYKSNDGDRVTESIITSPEPGPGSFNQRENLQQNPPQFEQDSEKTTGVFLEDFYKNSDLSNMPMGTSAMNQISPVVGWLVCVEGLHRGRSFTLQAGKNFIGRNPSMNICLDGDKSVSRDRHVIIVYDPMNRAFYAQPGDSHELFYVNDRVVLTSVQLFDRDKITIGKAKLVFVPFCDLTFGWTEDDK